MVGDVLVALKRAFERWVGLQEPAIRIANHDLRRWLITTLLAISIAVIAAFAPGVHGYFDLDFRVAMLCLAPGVVFGVASNVWDKQVGLPPLGYGIALWVTSLLEQFYASALVSLSQPPGLFVFCALPILTACIHGLVYRTTPQTPFIAIATLLAMAGAYAVAPHSEALGAFAFAAPVAVGGALLSGMLSEADDQERGREVALRAAIQAQILENRASEVQRLSAALLGVVERNHDAGNALSTSLLAADFLVDATKSEARDERDRDESHDVAIGLRAALARLKDLVDDTRRLGRDETPAGEGEVTAVIPLPVAQRVVGDLTRRFPKVRIACHAATQSAEVVAAAVCGGEETLYRILENLLLNACQGNGVIGAARVDIFVRDAPQVGALIVQVIDDGPGFALAQLQRPIDAFETTKREGTGLGLYTAERMMRASGGSLQRANGLDGGAVVTLYFAEAGAV